MRSFLTSIARHSVVVAFYIVGLPLLWVLESIFPVRLGIVYTQRIGHLAANTDVFFRALSERQKKKRCTYILSGWDPANRQLFDMFVREHGIIENRLLTWILFSCREHLKRTRFWEGMPFNGGHEYKIYNTTSPIISFTLEEEERGRRELEKMGIGKDDWFVCFHCRDQAYLRQWRPELNEIWQKQGFKNADIMTYLDAAAHIANAGGFALRMGAAVERPLPDDVPPGVIDYATKHRSDFMDIYLAAKCRFFLASSTGLGQVPTVFNRPVVVANHFSYNHTHYLSGDLIVPRPILDKETGDVVPFFTAKENRFFEWIGEVTSNGMNKELYDWGYVDSEDILNGVRDMLDQLEGRAPPAGAKVIQDRYAVRYLSHLPDYQLGARLSPRYALKYAHLI